MICTESQQRLDRVVISPADSIGAALAHLDQAGTGALLLCTGERKLYALLSDGDVRRAILRGMALEEPCHTIANRVPVVSFASLSPAEALYLMNQHDIDHLPVLNAEAEIQDFLMRKDFWTEDGIGSCSMKRLDSVIISPTASISEAVARLNKSGTGALALCTEGHRLCGLLTDGDLRRSILHGVSIDDACHTIANRQPMTVCSPVSMSQALKLMNEYDIDHLPVVDAEGRLVEFRLRRDISSVRLNLSAVIMAGGFGKRLLPLTEQVPKPMLPIGDRPLLELTIQKLRNSGVRDVSLTTHYLPDNIVKHFGDGQQFGVKLSYYKEEQPMGTAGGLKLMKRTDGPFLVINGDILSGVSFQEMLAYHRKVSAEITVGVRKYEVQVPFGVVECKDVNITQLREKPLLNFFINAGMYILEPSAWDSIPEGQRFDMTDLIQKLLDDGRLVVGFPIMEYWLDVGRHEDLMRANEDVRNGRI